MAFAEDLEMREVEFAAEAVAVLLVDQRIQAFRRHWVLAPFGGEHHLVFADEVDVGGLGHRDGEGEIVALVVVDVLLGEGG